MLHTGFLTQLFAEGNAIFGTLTHQLQAALGESYKTHRILKPAGAEAPLGNLKATAFALDHIADRYPNIFKNQSGFTARRMQAVKDTQWPNQFNTRRVARYKDG